MEFHQPNLPHVGSVGTPLFVTFRLNGSLPSSRLFPLKLTSGRLFAAMDRLLDEPRYGPTHLTEAAIAQIVEDAILALDVPDAEPDGYTLHGWVIMPNHVHLLITPHSSSTRLVQRIKTVTARKANKVLGLTGQFWQQDSYDRLVRHEDEFRRIVRYIEMNPVNAGLVGSPELYRWSSKYHLANEISRAASG